MSQLRNRNLALIFAGICFGTTGSAQALGPKLASPLAIGSARLMIGAALLFLFHQRTREIHSRISARDLWIAALGVALYQITFFSAVRSTGVAIGTITALGSAPATTGIIAYLLSRERPTRRWFMATILTTMGIVVLGTSKGITDFNLRGFLLAIGAGAAYSFFAVASKHALADGASVSDAMSQIFVRAAIISSPLIFVGDLHWLATARGAVMILWLGIIPTAVAYIAYAYGLAKVRASTASTLILAEPATATLLALFVLGEQVTARGWMGLCIVGLGLIYLSLS